ncbi:uncharacterized protein LOC117654630 [Pantherophis guttatus]|uniref:Uncharacterized protein LOC117654630 n=1 Tax=Pantherophis guttatus TaxID=94885 RepID=A0A6P9AIP5_PANGU|nr:uncharacterized protein LOC117654630 [Pantherophis guttatus]
MGMSTCQDTTVVPLALPKVRQEPFKSQGQDSTEALEDSSGQDFPHPGGSNPSRPTVTPADHLAIEWRILSQDNLSSRVIQNIQASRRPSTDRVFDATWRVFCTWCSRMGTDPSSVSVAHILDFLQDGLDKGLTPNTIRRQVAALSSVLSCGSLESLTKHPTVHRFLRGATNLRPPVVHRYPIWDLMKVLNTLTRGPFEPIRLARLRFHTCKVAFLVAITSARFWNWQPFL